MNNKLYAPLLALTLLTHHQTSMGIFDNFYQEQVVKYNTVVGTLAAVGFAILIGREVWRTVYPTQTQQNQHVAVVTNEHIQELARTATQDVFREVLREEFAHGALQQLVTAQKETQGRVNLLIQRLEQNNVLSTSSVTEPSRTARADSGTPSRPSHPPSYTSGRPLLPTTVGGAAGAASAGDELQRSRSASPAPSTSDVAAAGEQALRRSPSQESGVGSYVLTSQIGAPRSHKADGE